MSFGTDLRGKPAHDALLCLQDFEIKLLEHVKKNIILRIKIDRDYSSSLASLAASISKYDTSEFDTPFSQVSINTFRFGIKNEIRFLTSNSF